jgi:hypothetical protein
MFKRDKFAGGTVMTTTKTKETIQETILLTLPREIVDDLNKIASFNENRLEDLMYSYIVDGIASDSRAVNRMKFTDKANEVIGKNNIPPKTVEDIFNNLVY